MKPMGFFPFYDPWNGCASFRDYFCKLKRARLLFEMQGHREPERALGHDFGVAAPPMFSSNGAIVT